MISQSASQEHEPFSTKRPRILTLLSIAILLISGYHLLTFSQVLQHLPILQSLPLKISPVYLAVDGIIWGISGLILTWGLWTGKPWSGKVGKILAFLYTAVFWIDLIWIAEPKVLHTRWLFNLAVTLVVLPVVYFSLDSKTSRGYLNRNSPTID